jgi:hypothetical protein
MKTNMFIQKKTKEKKKKVAWSLLPVANWYDESSINTVPNTQWHAKVELSFLLHMSRASICPSV